MRKIAVAAAGNIESTSDFGVIKGRSASFYALVAGLVVVVAAGGWAAHAMESEGHHITGMNNQIVWGIPHVFAIFLIVTASGALNVASLSSLMGRKLYAPYARLSALLAIALLLGGLAVITLDLGRPDRLVVALTHFNMKSVFAWNVLLYTGFVLLAVLYLWALMERRFNGLTRPVGAVLLLWRIALTTGTGLIFGVLVARQAYDVALMAPQFIAMSLSFGTAASLLLLMAVCRGTGRPLDDAVVLGLKGMLVWFVTIVLYLAAVHHGVKLYASGSQGVERFLLLEGGAITGLFWLGQVAVGSLAPLLLMLWPATSRSRLCIGLSAGLVLLGGFAQIYVIVIGGQAFPLQIFPGKEVVESSFYDGMVSSYQPSLPEVLLGLGGVAAAILIVVAGMKVLEFLPQPRRAD